MRRSTAGEASGREFIVLVTALMATAAMAIDTILPAFADMRQAFDMPPDSGQVGWTVTAFFLGMSVGPWLYGPASDRFGRRTPLYVGLVVYVLSGVVAATTSRWEVLVVARFVWGVGAAGPRSLAVAIVRDRYSGDQMARLMSLIMAVFLLVPIAAPAVGAGLLAVLPWRSVLWFPVVMALGLMVWARRLPETLRLEDRRPFTLRSFVAASREVVTHRQTRNFALAVMCIYGVVSAYLTGSELIVNDVFDLVEWFPLFFSGIAMLLALSSLLSAWLVRRIGVVRLVRRSSIVSFVSSFGLLAVSSIDGGHPPFWLFVASLAVVLAISQALGPSLNTLAMQPVPHIAGTASAVIGTVTIAGGAVIGGLTNAAFDGSIRPMAVAFVVLTAATAGLVLFGATTRPAVGD